MKKLLLTILCLVCADSAFADTRVQVEPQQFYSSVAFAFQTKSANFTVISGFNVFTGSTASQTGTLPAPASTAGQRIVIKNQSSVSLTAASASGSQIIATGATSASSSVTVTSGQLAIFWSDGTYWNEQ